jgi:hypothetical protein
MKSKSRFLVVAVTLLVSGLLQNVEAAGKEGEWLRVPGAWLLHRFVRPSTAPARTYRVALVVPPGSKEARITQSSGSRDVDKVAGDFAQSSIISNKVLRDLAKSKELEFKLILTPSALDVKMRSKEGQRPAPPGKELYTPFSESFFYSAANQNETASRPGELVVIFPPEGGYAAESIITVSTGNAAADRYYLHSSALNWQTTRKSTKDQILRTPFTVAKPQRWQSILDQ